MSRIGSYYMQGQEELDYVIEKYHEGFATEEDVIAVMENLIQSGYMVRHDKFYDKYMEGKNGK